MELRAVIGVEGFHAISEAMKNLFLNSQLPKPFLESQLPKKAARQLAITFPRRTFCLFNTKLYNLSNKRLFEQFV